jgi:CRISPR/Cas system CMR-associated protein Cmr5 small subunit
MASRQQKWAIAAHEEVLKWVDESAGKRAKYKTWCRRSASLLQQSGLVQTVVFMKAKGDDDGSVVGDALARVLLLDKGATLDTLVRSAKEAPTPRYMALTRDLTSVCIWFRRFAEIEITDPENL